MSLMSRPAKASCGPVLHPLSHLSPHHLVGTVFVPDTVPGVGDTKINKKQSLPLESSRCLMEEFILQLIHSPNVY